MAAPASEHAKLRQEMAERMCEIEATVPTGFEALAREEIEEKIGSKVTHDIDIRGRVSTLVRVSDAVKLLELRSIDNLLVILNHYRDFKFSNNTEEAIQQIRDIVPELDWDLGLSVWEQFNEFPHPISRLPISLQRDLASSDLRHQYNTERDDRSEHDCIKEEETESNLVTVSTEAAEGDDLDLPSERKKRKTQWKANTPSFRATCYRAGSKSIHSFGSPLAGSNFGGAIHDYFEWNVDLENYDIECVLNIEGNNMSAGICLTKQSLHRRNIVKFGVTTLRPTIAYSMLRLCRVKSNDVVCDPMCGSGSIPIEAAINWPQARHICGDLFDAAPIRTKENIDALNKGRLEKRKSLINVDVFHWDSTRLPLKEASVDVFVTDLPFGKRSGSKVRNWHLYPQVLEEMGRVARPSIGRACFLTMDKKCFVKSSLAITSLWRRGPTLAVNIGGLPAAVYMLYRTSTAFMDRNQAEPKSTNTHSAIPPTS